jgi:hypothetical protein
LREQERQFYEATINSPPIQAEMEQLAELWAQIDDLELAYLRNLKLNLAFQNRYEPDRLPYETLLLTALSFFTVADELVAGYEFVSSAMRGDWGGAALSVVDVFVQGPLDQLVDGIRGGRGVSRSIDDGSSALGVGGGTNPFGLRTGHAATQSTFRNAVNQSYEQAGIKPPWLTDLPTELGYDAHHMIAWDSGFAREAAGILEHNVVNGVLVPTYLHARLHTKPYYNAITTALVRASEAGGNTGVRQMMDDLAELIDGSSYEFVQEWNKLKLDDELDEVQLIAAQNELAARVRNDLIEVINNLGK